MAKYTGSWAKGFASTFNPVAGINLGLQWKEKKKAQKKIDDAIEQLKNDSMELAAKFDKARADKIITQQEFGDAMAWAIPLGKEISGRTETLYKNFMDMTPEQLDIELANIKAILDFSEGLDFTNLEQMKEFGNKLTQPNAKMQWDLIIKSIEGRDKPMRAEAFPTAEEVMEKYPEAGYKYTEEGYVPTFQKEEAPTIADEKSAVTLLRTFLNATTEQFEAHRTRIEQNTGLDLSAYTQDILRETGTEMFNLYNTPEEVMANVKAPTNLIVVPSRDSKTGKYYASFQKKAAGGGGAITDINDVLFGTTGIMKNYIGSGSQLGEEQKMEIRNNYDIMKPSLGEETQTQVEEYLSQIDIDVSKAIPEPEVLLDIKKKPIWQASWKYYQNLTVEELYQLADKENDKKAYDELKRRGKIQ